MASAPEYVVKPCVGIRRLFDAAVEAAGAGGPDPDSDWGVPAAFRRQLSTEEAIAAVPILTKSSFQRVLPPGTLVRYRGMVQFGFPLRFHEPAVPEAAPAGLRWHMGRYAPIPASVVDAPGYTPRRASHMEFYCVPLPGQGEWAREQTVRGASEAAASVLAARRAEMAVQAAAGGARAGKRQADDTDESSAPASSPPRSGVAAGAPSSPASVGTAATGVAGATPDRGVRAKLSSSPHTPGGGVSLAADGFDDEGGDLPLDAYNPLPGEEDECPCLATLFGVGADTPLRAGQAVEVFGVLQGDVVAAPPGGPGSAETLTPEQAAALGLTAVQAHMLSQPEHWALNPSAASVPRVHAVVWRSLAPAFPLLQPPLAPCGPFSLLDVGSGTARCVAEPPASGPAAAAADPFAAADAAVAAVRALTDHEAAASRELTARTRGLEASGRAALAALPAVTSSTPAALRAEAAAYLTALTGGDPLAGEFVLLALLSRVVMRTEGRAVGKLSVNVCGYPETASPPGPGPAAAAAAASSSSSSSPSAPVEPPAPTSAEGLRRAGVPVPLSSGASFWPRILHAGVRHVYPRAACLPMTRPVLASVDVAPRKDNTVDRLRAGVLQLPDGTALVVDETPLSAGAYHGRAFKALNALKALATTSHALYDFSASDTAAGTYVLPFPADVPLVVLSASKSVLGCDAVVPLSPAARAAAATTAAAGAMPPAPDAGFVDRCRVYLATARHLPFSYSDGLREAMQRDLVAFRASHTAEDPVTAEDLHRLMDTARLVAASHCATDLAPEHWEHVKAMERERRERVRAAREALRAAAGPGTPPRASAASTAAAATPPPHGASSAHTP